MSSFKTNDRGLFVFGSSQVHNVDVSIEDDRVKSMRKLTNGYLSTSNFLYYDPFMPLAVGILYGDLLDISLQEGKSYLSLSDRDIFEKVKYNLVDLVVVSPLGSPATTGCDIFDKLHPPWGLSSERNYVLPLPSRDLTLGRCVKTTMKFLPKLYKEQTASPGHQNFCQYNDVDGEMEDSGDGYVHVEEGEQVVFSPGNRPIPLLVRDNENEGVGAEDDDNFLESIDSDLFSKIMGISPDERRQMTGGDIETLGNRNSNEGGIQVPSETPQTVQQMSQTEKASYVFGLATSTPPLFHFVTENPILFEFDNEKPPGDDIETNIDSHSNTKSVENLERYRRMDNMEACSPNRPPQVASPMDQQPSGEGQSQDAPSTLGNFVKASQANDRLATIGGQVKEFLWATTRYFKNEWLELMKKYQPDIMPWEYLTGKSGEQSRYWVEYLHDALDPSKSAVRCWQCFLFFDSFFLKPSWKSDFGKEAGKRRPRKIDLLRDIEAHYYSPGHQGVVTELTKEHVETIEEMFEILQRGEKTTSLLKTTANHLRSVYAALVWNLAFLRYEELITLQEYNEAMIGRFLRTHQAMKKMTMFLSDIADKNLANFMLEQNVPFSLLVDESTNRKHENFLVVLVQVPENNMPVVYLFSLIHILDADAESLFEYITMEFEKRGLKDFLRQNLRAVASDGASVMTGKESGLCARFEDHADHKLQCMHCAAHRSNLVAEWALKIEDWYDDLLGQTKNVYKYYQIGHKNRDSLMKTSKELGLKLREPRLVYDIRWISSVDTVFKSLIHNWKIYLINLQSAATEKGKKIFEDLRNRENMIAFFFATDITTLMGQWSRNLQYSGDTIFTKEKEKKEIMRLLDEMKATNGKMLDEFKNSVTCSGKLPTDDTFVSFRYLEEKTGCSEHEYYFAETVTWQGMTLAPPNLVPKMPRLDDIRSATLENLRNEITYYFPKDSVLRAFSVFDPTTMPFDNSLVATYGEEKIREVAKLIEPESSESYLSEVVNEWKMLMQQFLNYASFQKDVQEVRAKNTKNVRDKHFWYKYLNKSPNTFIFPSKIRELIRVGMTIPASTADAERAFSLMTKTVTKLRGSLSPLTTEAVMRIVFNGPYFKEFPAQLLSIKWVEKNMRADDPTYSDEHLRKRAKLSSNDEDIEDQEINPKYLRGKSMLY